VGFKKYFHRVIQRHFPQQAIRLLLEIEAAFKRLQPEVRFVRTSKNPVERRLEIAAYFPATIEVLHQAGESFENIRTALLEIANDYVRPKNYFHGLLKRLPPKLIETRIGVVLIQQLAKRAKNQAHPDGFVVQILTDKKETLGFGYGIDILECGICKLFQRHSMQKFAPLLCEIDHITSSLAGLTLKRTGTIALGASKCDFRFVKK
jgi:hypothetical protein